MVVPYNKNTEVGYREIPETTTSLKKILGKIVESHKDDADEDAKNKAFDALQELVTNVQFANDEGDPGMGLELGNLDFFFLHYLNYKVLVFREGHINLTKSPNYAFDPQQMFGPFS